MISLRSRNKTNNIFMESLCKVWKDILNIEQIGISHSKCDPIPCANYGTFTI